MEIPMLNRIQCRPAKRIICGIDFPFQTHMMERD